MPGPDGYPTCIYRSNVTWCFIDLMRAAVLERTLIGVHHKIIRKGVLTGFVTSLLISWPWQFKMLGTKAIWQKLAQSRLPYPTFSNAWFILPSLLDRFGVITRHEQNWHFQCTKLADDLTAHSTRRDGRWYITCFFFVGIWVRWKEHWTIEITTHVTTASPMKDRLPSLCKY